MQSESISSSKTTSGLPPNVFAKLHGGALQVVLRPASETRSLRVGCCSESSSQIVMARGGRESQLMNGSYGAQTPGPNHLQGHYHASGQWSESTELDYWPGTSVSDAGLASESEPCRSRWVHRQAAGSQRKTGRKSETCGAREVDLPYIYL